MRACLCTIAYKPSTLVYPAITICPTRMRPIMTAVRGARTAQPTTIKPAHVRTWLRSSREGETPEYRLIYQLSAFGYRCAVVAEHPEQRQRLAAQSRTRGNKFATKHGSTLKGFIPSLVAPMSRRRERLGRQQQAFEELLDPVFLDEELTGSEGSSRKASADRAKKKKSERAFFRLKADSPADTPSEGVALVCVCRGPYAAASVEPSSSASKARGACFDGLS